MADPVSVARLVVEVVLALEPLYDRWRERRDARQRSELRALAEQRARHAAAREREHARRRAEVTRRVAELRARERQLHDQG